MPFSHVKSEFQPEQLAKMTAAFDMAWPTVSAANSCDKIGLLRERLAHYIIACASGGELDPDKLKGLAIKAFTRQDATNSSAEFARLQIIDTAPTFRARLERSDTKGRD